ncbi:MAG: EamA family transporter [Actinomycetes bacterium]
MSQYSRAGVAVLGAATLFGTSASSQALLTPGAPGPSVAAMRLLVGAAGLLAIVAWRRGGRSLVTLWRSPLVWAMGVAVAGYQALFFLGADLTGVALGTLVSLAFAPFIAGVLGWLLREGAPGWVWLASTVIAVLGVALLVRDPDGTANPAGICCAVGAGACYAMYTVLGVRLTREGHPSTSVMASSFSLGAVVLIPFAVTSTWWLSGRGVAEVLWLGLAATTVAYVLFGLGLRVLQPGHIATLNLLEPVVATVLAVLLLGESLGGAGWCGVVLVLVALAILGIASSKRSTSPLEAA